MKQEQYLSLLSQGNKSFQCALFSKAIWYYERLILENPFFEKYIRLNLAFAYKRLKGDHINKNMDSIDIVIPVYNALEDVKKCLESIKCSTDGFDVRVIVVNDGSDEITTQWLREYSSSDPILYLIENTENIGYTKTVNIGLKASSASFVILQNSDTIVSRGWLFGLIRCIQSNPKIGIVGPLSNAANWQNVPQLRDEEGSFSINKLDENLSVDDMAQLVARTSMIVYPSIPIVNGFCFMIKRKVVDTIGYMDEENFPTGYGEETDYCIRAFDAGFELVIADDVYVFHAKSKSFGHERRKELSWQGTQSLKKKHTPEKYFSRVNEAKKTQMLDEVRERIQQELFNIKIKENDK